MTNYRECTPIKVDQKFNDLYFAFIDPEGNTRYEKIRNTKSYFYHADYKQNIIKKEEAVKHFIDNSWETKKISQTYPNTYEADVSLAKRFLIDTYSGMKSIPKKELRVAYLDIENLVTGKITQDGIYPISAITVYDSKIGKYFTFGYHKNYKAPHIDKENKIFLFPTEMDMFKFFIKFWVQANFHVVVGWNISYDMDNIYNRLIRLDHENGTQLCNQLSPFGITEIKWGTTNASIFGVSIIDYMQIYKKFNQKTVRSFSLNNIANEELGTGKLKYEGDLNKLYSDEFDKYIEYNRKDVELLVLLEEKLQFLNLLHELACIGIENLEDAIDSSKTHDNVLIRMLNAAGKIVTSKSSNYSYKGKSNAPKGEDGKKPEGDEDASYVGGYLFPVVPKIHKGYIWVFDVNSLYPTIIRMLNISPETMDENGSIVSGYGTRFKSHPNGILNSYLTWLYKTRKEYQKLEKENKGKPEEAFYFNKQYAYKILLNSLYGFLGFRGGRFYSNDLKYNMANCTTTTGQIIIQQAGKIAEEGGFSVCAGDTDSIMITNESFNHLTPEEAVEKGKELEAILNTKMKLFIKERFNTDNVDIFNMEFEKLAGSGVHYFPRRYVHHLIWKGRFIDEMVYCGIEVTRSDCGPFSEAMLKEIYEYMLKTPDYSKDNVYDIVKKYEEKFKNLPITEYGIPFQLRKSIEDFKLKSVHLKGIEYYNKYLLKGSMKNFDIPKGSYYFVKSHPNGYEDVEAISIPEGENALFNNNTITGFELDMDRIFDRFITKKLSNIIGLMEGKDITEDKGSQRKNPLYRLVGTVLDGCTRNQLVDKFMTENVTLFEKGGLCYGFKSKVKGYMQEYTECVDDEARKAHIDSVMGLLKMPYDQLINEHFHKFFVKYEAY